MKVVGIKELAADFKRITSLMSTAEVRQVFRKAAGKIRDRARKNAPRSSGLLRRAIISFATKGRSRTKDQVAFARVNVNKRGRVRAPHAHLVEGGTKDRRPKPGHKFLKGFNKRTRQFFFVKSVKGAEPKPFFEPAVRQLGPSVLIQAAREIAEKIGFSAKK